MIIKHLSCPALVLTLASSAPVWADSNSSPLTLKEFIAESSSQDAEALLLGEESFSNRLNFLTQETTPVEPIEKVQTTPQSEPVQGNYGYVSLGLGVGFPNNATADDVGISIPPLTPTNSGFPGSVDQSFDAGFAGEIAGGYQFQDVRVELSVGYGDLNPADGTLTANIQGQQFSTSYNVDGGGNYVSVLVNAYYDIPTGTKWRPYLGAGIGYINLSYNDVVVNTQIGQATVIGGNSGSAFGYQGKLGLSYEAIPKGNIFGEVVYLGSTTPSGTEGSYSSLGLWRLALGWRQGF
ncbi:MAG: outer membrane protein [Cyanobacteriota bacterium]|jgi:opacity protein-like surface antigen